MSDDDPLGFDGDAVHNEEQDTLLGLERRALEGRLDGRAEILQAIEEPQLLLALQVQLLELGEPSVEAARVLLDALTPQAQLVQVDDRALISVEEALLLAGEALKAAADSLLLLVLMEVHGRVGVANVEAGAQQCWGREQGANVLPDALLNRCGGQGSTVAT